MLTAPPPPPSTFAFWLYTSLIHKSRKRTVAHTRAGCKSRWRRPPPVELPTCILRAISSAAPWEHGKPRQRSHRVTDRHAPATVGSRFLDPESRIVAVGQCAATPRFGYWISGTQPLTYRQARSVSNATTLRSCLLNSTPIR